MRILATFAITSLLFAAQAVVQSAVAQPATPLTLQQVMADPDWIGAPVEQAWWSWDGQRAYYTRKRDGATIRDIFAQPIAGGVATLLDGSARAELDAAQPVYDAQRARMAFVRNGDVFVRDLRSGALTQLTRSNDDETQPQWNSDGGLAWRVGNAWFRWTAGAGVAQAAIVKAEKDPAAPPKSGDLRDRQLRLIDTLKNDRAQRDALEKELAALRETKTSLPEPEYYEKLETILLQIGRLYRKEEKPRAEKRRPETPGAEKPRGKESARRSN